MATLVTGRMVEDGTVATNDLQQGAVTTEKIALSSITANRLAPNAAIPAGAVMSFAMSTPPAGWLACNGAAISRDVYSALFNAIGVIYGVGNNSTTFNVPDLRGEFIRGWDGGRNVDSGRTFGSSQGDAFRAHKHDPIDPGGTWGGRPRGVSGNSTGADGDLDGSVRVTGYDKASVYLDFTTVGGSETRPRNIALLYCIKF